ncbi:GntR family transcriptional regulator [Actinorugispora endophytica]|uniref:GntR family transcriptional regulator n=1 Tax=Actinorugispora endophytica TaxID=1605990 RepID=A0A4R6VEJ3_9ACTN|nr:GntR family transcriptional regulator [Actinorugispora endophytica]TDQ55467.1 GntR family transcriptional regulator [Actinorugispora endophytica]
MAAKPRYQQIADILRGPILGGALPPGTRLPSRVQLSRRYAVSEQVSRHALRLLVAEGLAESRPGSGYYVRATRADHLLPRTGSGPGSALAPLLVERRGTRSEAAARGLAVRLRVRAGETLYRTECLGHARGAPIALHVSWEPAALTLNTSGAPGAAPALSVSDRLAGVGVFVDRIEEEVSVRALRGPEADRLGLPSGSAALVVRRTHFDGRRPVETSDLIASADHCRLGYRFEAPRRAP